MTLLTILRYEIVNIKTGSTKVSRLKSQKNPSKSLAEKHNQ